MTACPSHNHSRHALPRPPSNFYCFWRILFQHLLEVSARMSAGMLCHPLRGVHHHNLISPPLSPPSGPRSITQSPQRITSRLCTITPTTPDPDPPTPLPASSRNLQQPQQRVLLTLIPGVPTPLPSSRAGRHQQGG